jgi:hypothetical protein
MRQWTFVIEHLTENDAWRAIHPRWAAYEMLSLGRWFPVDLLAMNLPRGISLIGPFL